MLHVEGIANYGLNVVSFVWATLRRIWYVVGAYMPPNDAPAIVRVEEALRQTVK